MILPPFVKPPGIEVMKLIKFFATSLIAFTIGACGPSGDNSGSTLPDLGAGCSANDIKQWAYDNLRDYYLYYDQVPAVNPANYATAGALVEALRVQPFDRFSHISNSSIENEMFVEGKTFGLGYLLQTDSENRLRVGAVYRDSPLGRAGINRGDEFIGINDVTLDQLTNAKYAQFVGTRDQPNTANWTFRDANTQQLKVVSITPALYNLNTVLHSETINHPEYSGKIGYMVLDSFLTTSESEIDDAFITFRNDGIDELILDLRYNGGGLVSIAAKLVSQIAGSSTDDKLLMEYRHNQKYSEYDFPIYFESEEIDLNLNRLIVLTTGSTASSSEIVINALSPYIDVVTIGGRTTGKPYITLGNDLCGQTMHAIQAEGFNANNVSVYGGIAPSCSAVDDVTRDFGMPDSSQPIEGMLGDALNHIIYGECNTFAVANEAIQNDSPGNQLLIHRFAEERVNQGARMDRQFGF